MSKLEGAAIELLESMDDLFAAMIEEAEMNSTKTNRLRISKIVEVRADLKALMENGHRLPPDVLSLKVEKMLRVFEDLQGSRKSAKKEDPILMILKKRKRG